MKLWLLISVARCEESRLTQACLALDSGACTSLVEKAGLSLVSLSAGPVFAQFVLDKTRRGGSALVERVSTFCDQVGLGAFDCALLQRATQQEMRGDDWHGQCSAGAAALERMAFLSTFPAQNVHPAVFSDSFGFSWTFSGAAEGEAWLELLDTLTDFEGSPRDRIMLDVGANQGDFSASLLAAKRRNESWTIYQFEPDQTEASKLRARGFDEAGVKVHVVEAAATDLDGLVTLHVPNDVNSGPQPHATLAQSAHVWKHGAMSTPIQVRALSLDSWAAQALHEQHVDLLKVDAEGSDPLVLNGARRLLTTTDALLFEYSHLWATTGTSLRAVIQLALNSEFDRVYLIGRHSALLDLRCWNDDYETWWWSNVLAVRSSARPMLARSLRRRHDRWHASALQQLISNRFAANSCQLTLGNKVHFRPPFGRADLTSWRDAVRDFVLLHNFTDGAGCVESASCVADVLLAHSLAVCTTSPAV